jgi:hypothetical protein
MQKFVAIIAVFGNKIILTKYSFLTYKGAPLFSYWFSNTYKERNKNAIFASFVEITGHFLKISGIQ